MKQLRLSFAAGLLLLALTIPTFAGDMYGGYVQPPPPPQQDTITGDMYGGYVQPSEQTGEASDINPIAEIALNLIQSAFFLF